jgi:hypothetical protein
MSEEKMKAMIEASRQGATKSKMVEAMTGYTQEQLQAAFNLVANPSDWKLIVESYCTSDEIKIVYAAVEHFTATIPTFDYIRLADAPMGRFKTGDHIFKVRAAGYALGPAGDN